MIDGNKWNERKKKNDGREKCDKKIIGHGGCSLSQFTPTNSSAEKNRNLIK